MFTEFNTLTREAFMLILARIWNTQATKERLVSSARRVGITSEMLSVEFMHQDKFHLAEQCLDQTPVSSNNEQLVSSGVESIESPEKFRKFSSLAIGNKFNQAIAIINELHKKSIVLSEISNFLTVQKVKPKLSKENVRVTQQYGSMKANKMIEAVKEIKEKKEHAAVQKQEAIQKKKSHSFSARQIVFAKEKGVLLQA